MANKMKAFSLLNSLDACNEPFSTAMLKPLMPSYTEIMTLLQGYELRTSLHDLISNPSFALYEQRNNGSNSREHWDSGGGSGHSQQPLQFSSCGCEFYPTSHSARDTHMGPETNDPTYKQPNGPPTHDPPVVCQICGKKAMLPWNVGTDLITRINSMISLKHWLLWL